MLRAATSAGRLASRGARLIPRSNLPAAAVAMQRLSTKAFNPSTPVSAPAGTKPIAAPATEATPASLPIGKISQVIGAVVDVHFGKLFFLDLIYIILVLSLIIFFYIDLLTILSV